MSEIVCPSCGSACPAGAVFCQGCGSNLASAGALGQPQTADESTAVTHPAPARYEPTPAVGPISTKGEKPEVETALAPPRDSRLATLIISGCIILTLIGFSVAIGQRLSRPHRAGALRASGQSSAARSTASSPDALDAQAEGESGDLDTAQLEQDIANLEDGADAAEAAEGSELAAWADRYGLLSPGGQVDSEQGLIYAAGFDDLPHLKALLDHHPDLSATNADGFTAVYAAAYNGSWEALSLLLRAGANPNAEAPNGATPLHQAAGNGDNLGCAMLLRYGAEIEPYDSEGLTPLMHAVSKGYSGAAQILLNAGAGVDTRSRDGLSSLMAAAQNSQPQMLNLLINNGADVSLVDPSGWTALHFAAAAGDTSCINILDSAGADHNALDAEGNSPADIARKYRNDDVANTL